MTPIPPDPEDVHALTRALLVQELDRDRFSHLGYLPWLYDQSPRGPALQQHVDDSASGQRVGHYAILPTRFRDGDRETTFIFSTNVATDSTTRRSGLFRGMADAMYAEAAMAGAPAMIGVGNDASTIVVVDRFGWRKLAPMRAIATWALPTKRTKTFVVTPEFLASEHFAILTRDLAVTPVTDWAQTWDTEFLRWRLSRPDGGYRLHVVPEAIGVSVKAKGPMGVPCSVLLKVWPRAGSRVPVHAGPIVAASLRAHRAVACIYAGWNANARVRGIAIPHRLQPSPLNVVLKVLDPTAIDANTFRLETWEFLDMDAY